MDGIMNLSRKTSSVLALMMGGTSLAIATPIMAGFNTGLRGAQPMAMPYGVQYTQTFASPTVMPPNVNLRPGFNVQSGGYVQPQYGQTQYVRPQYRQPQMQPQQAPVYTPYAAQRRCVGPQNVCGGPVRVATAAVIPVGDYSVQGLRRPSTGWAPQLSVGGGLVQANARHTERMLDWQENTTGKVVTLLANRQNGILPRNSLTVGGAIKGAFMWQNTSEPGQFPILSRFPDFTPGSETSSGVFAINNAALAFTGSFGDWTTVYMQPEYSETEFFGQDEMQLRKAFVVLGNLDRTPFYLAFGRKTIDFGNFDGYNPFVQTEAQHYFYAASDQPVFELGFYNKGWKIVGSAFSGGRQLRVAYAGEENNNQIANYSASIEKEFLFRDGNSFTVGASYLHDTSYRNNYTAHTFQLIQSGNPPDNFISYRNGAVDAFAEYNSDWLDLMFEYSTSLKPWAAAIPQDASGVPFPEYLIDPAGSTTDIDNIDFDQRLEVFTAQARIKPLLPNGKRLALSAVGSWGNIGDDFQGVGIGGQPTSWKSNQQHVLGIEYPVSDYLDIGAEYVYNKGFIPFVGPQLVSNDDTIAHAVNIGLKARF